MKNIVIAFRGRNTDAILSEVVVSGDTVMAVCREGDNLAQTGDLTPAQAIESLRREDAARCSVSLIANGGTTEQQVTLVVFLTDISQGWQGPYVILDAQRDGVKVLAKRAATLTWEDRPFNRLSWEEIPKARDNLAEAY